MPPSLLVKPLSVPLDHTIAAVYKHYIADHVCKLRSYCTQSSRSSNFLIFSWGHALKIFLRLIPSHALCCVWLDHSLLCTALSVIQKSQYYDSIHTFRISDIDHTIHAWYTEYHLCSYKDHWRSCFNVSVIALLIANWRFLIQRVVIDFYPLFKDSNCFIIEGLFYCDIKYQQTSISTSHPHRCYCQEPWPTFHTKYLCYDEQSLKCKYHNAVTVIELIYGIKINSHGVSTLSCSRSFQC